MQGIKFSQKKNWQHIKWIALSLTTSQATPLQTSESVSTLFSRVNVYISTSFTWITIHIIIYKRDSKKGYHTWKQWILVKREHLIFWERCSLLCPFTSLLKRGCGETTPLDYPSPSSVGSMGSMSPTFANTSLCNIERNNVVFVLKKSDDLSLDFFKRKSELCHPWSPAHVTCVSSCISKLHCGHL